MNIGNLLYLPVSKRHLIMAHGFHRKLGQRMTVPTTPSFETFFRVTQFPIH
eukprot:CAMPEP_0172562236 /NCGR_PEP_ID=MMETSP1067-20121228/96142_1 /TAXON_ID=265564 ORGANISM="Thalassiosira punctigera, Strain Tpunct2005C2" /NCGR_SAMPLE_ID=MMETSP1067 /ASSEMBLY_ACC=CAM_ASM_000444 /LENGTH=50 /DNA_ID=CAMNT_0013352429 /DNA_START=327 /DNA_END=476 /DNA_ORIENTATION=+